MLKGSSILRSGVSGLPLRSPACAIRAFAELSDCRLHAIRKKAKFVKLSPKIIRGPRRGGPKSLEKLLRLRCSDQGFVMNFEASATSSLPKISKLAEAFDNFEVWVLMSLAHRRGLWPLASCSALRSQASGSCAGPLLPNKSAAKYRPREASAKLAPAGRPMSIFYWFLQVKVALLCKNPT